MYQLLSSWKYGWFLKCTSCFHEFFQFSDYIIFYNFFQEATSGSNGGRMSITEEEANDASDGLETEDDDSNEDEDLSQDSSGEEGRPKI